MITSPFLLTMCRIAGTALALTSLLLTVQFGLTISVGIAAALATVSIMASYIWAIATEVHRNAGNGFLANVVKIGAVVVAVGVTSIDAITNSSTTGTHRVTDVHTASVQTTNSTNVSQALADARRNLAMQERRLRELTSANRWNAAVTAVELRSRLETANEAVRQEERRGGCGPKCLALKATRDGIAADLGRIEEHNRTVGMIEATRQSITQLAARVAETPPAVSSVDTQNKKLASLFTLDRQPGEGATYWTDTWMMVAIGLIITLASQFFNMLAWVPSAGNRTHVARETVSAPETVATKEATVTILKPTKPEYTCTTIGDELRARLAA